MAGSPGRPAKGLGIMHCKRLVSGKKEFSGPYAVHKPTKAANTISVSFCILSYARNINHSEETQQHTSIHDCILLPANRFAVCSLKKSVQL